jgi:hypothetical protein
MPPKQDKVQRKSETYLLPNRRPRPQFLALVLLGFRLVDFEDPAVELGEVHVVDCFAGVGGVGVGDVGEAAVGCGVAFSGGGF